MACLICPIYLYSSALVWNLWHTWHESCWEEMLNFLNTCSYIIKWTVKSIKKMCVLCVLCSDTIRHWFGVTGSHDMEAFWKTMIYSLKYYFYSKCMTHSQNKCLHEISLLFFLFDNFTTVWNWISSLQYSGDVDVFLLIMAVCQVISAGLSWWWWPLLMSSSSWLKPTKTAKTSTSTSTSSPVKTFSSWESV